MSSGGCRGRTSANAAATQPGPNVCVAAVVLVGDDAVVVAGTVGLVVAVVVAAVVVGVVSVVTASVVVAIVVVVTSVVVVDGSVGGGSARALIAPSATSTPAVMPAITPRSRTSGQSIAV